MGVAGRGQRPAQDSSIAAADGWVTIAQVNIDVPGIGGTQRVVVHGEVSAYTDSNGLSNCGAGERCYVNTRIRDITSGVASAPGFYAFPPDIFHQELVGRQAMFLGASGPRTYVLQVDLVNGTDALGFSSPSLIVMTFPMNLAAPVMAPASDEGSPDAALNGGF